MYFFLSEFIQLVPLTPTLLIERVYLHESVYNSGEKEIRSLKFSSAILSCTVRSGQMGTRSFFSDRDKRSR